MVTVDNKEVVVVDGTEGKQYDRVGRPLFSHDSQRLAYTAGEGDKWFLVVNEVEEKNFDSTMPRDPTFSPDCKRVAYEESWNFLGLGNISWYEYYIVVDGEEGKKYDFLNIYSKDRSPIWEWGNRKPGDPQLGSVVFDSADRLHYLAAKGNQIYLVAELLK